MTTVRLVSMRVRPKRSADLAFASPGIIARRYLPLASIGTVVQAFDIDNFMQTLGRIELDPAGIETGRFVYSSAIIRAELERSNSITHRLKSEAAGAALDQAINVRESKWHARYKHRALISTAAQNAYPNKLLRLQALRVALTQQHDDIEASYNALGVGARPFRIQHRGELVSSTPIGPVTQKAHNIKSFDGDPGPAPGAPRVTEVVDAIVTEGFTQTTTTSYDSRVSPPLDESDEIRHLPLENRIRHIRGLVDLIDQELAETVTNYAMLATDRVLSNELANLDLEVFKLQVEYVNKFLFCPFSGRLVAIYREAGEAVGIGEGVVRVEADDPLLLLARFRSDLALVPGATTAQIETTDLFDPAGAPVPITIQGTVVSIRGHDAEIDQWDAVIECNNYTPQGQRLAINYEFDPDLTTITLA